MQCLKPLNIVKKIRQLVHNHIISQSIQTWCTLIFFENVPENSISDVEIFHENKIKLRYAENTLDYQHMVPEKNKCI